MKKSEVEKDLQPEKNSTEDPTEW